MTNKFTPGPWHFKAEYDCKKFGPENGHEVIYACSCCGGINFTADGDEADANGRLIAAAPCLLEALEELLGLRFYPQRPDGPVYVRAQDKARAAVKKARGEA